MDKRRIWIGAAAGFASVGMCAAVALSAARGPSGGPMSCATFAVSKGDALLIGHNLDDPVNETPGLVVVNKRGVA